MPALTISEVRAATGLSPSALRYYEAEGLIRSTGREGGKRVYDPDVLERLAVIDLLARGGFTIAEIAALLGDDGLPTAELRAAAEAKVAELEARIAEAEQAREWLTHVLRCPAPTPAECPHLRRIVREHARRRAARARGRGGGQATAAPSA